MKLLQPDYANKILLVKLNLPFTILKLGLLDREKEAGSSKNQG